MRLLFLPVIAGALLIGGEAVVQSQVIVRVPVPEVVVRVPAPPVIFPQVVVPFPIYGDYYESRRDVYAYGHRGHESRGRSHRDDHHDDHHEGGERR